MEISGKVLSVLAEQGGNGKNGAWRKRDFILETSSKYPKKVCISVWGDKIDQFGVKEGQALTVSIEVESREFNGKWYTDVKAWKVQKQDAAGEPQDMPQAPASAYSRAEIDSAPPADDLPF